MDLERAIGVISSGMVPWNWGTCSARGGTGVLYLRGNKLPSVDCMREAVHLAVAQHVLPRHLVCPSVQALCNASMAPQTAAAARS